MPLETEGKRIPRSPRGVYPSLLSGPWLYLVLEVVHIRGQKLTEGGAMQMGGPAFVNYYPCWGRTFQ